jgi:hypothetical protein
VSTGGIVESLSVIVLGLLGSDIVDPDPVSAIVSESELATDGSPPVVAPDGGTQTPPSHTNVDRQSPSTHVQLSVPGAQSFGTHLPIDAMHSWSAMHVPSGLQSHAASPSMHSPVFGDSAKQPSTRSSDTSHDSLTESEDDRPPTVAER